MQYKAKKFIASLLIFTMFFQVLPLSAFANERIIPISNHTEYTYASFIGSGYHTILNGGEGELQFDPGIWKEDLVFAKEDNDLAIKILDGAGGYAGSVTVEDCIWERRTSCLRSCSRTERS
jgi:hypothetical protein